MIIRYIYFLIVGLFANTFFAQDTQHGAFKTEYVVVLVIDGPRFSETFGDTTCSNIPNLCNELAPQGVLFTQFRANAPRTTTNAGHTAITTGVNQRIKNDGSQLPKNPSMFQYYMKEHGVDKNKLWVLSSKGKLSILGNTKDRKWNDLYTPHVYCGRNGNGADYVGDKATFDQAVHVIETYAPKLMLINLLAPDSWGHAGNWDRYLQGIRESDAYALKLWDLIQNHPEMKDKTALFITNDHGRNEDGFKDGFVSHGASTLSNRHIFLLALGPDFKKGVQTDSIAELIDIPATIAYLLNFTMPTGKGCVLNQLFSNQ